MRTLASTFRTRDQAEAAIERLEALGIARERIILKEVAQTAEGPAAPGASSAAFLSVKVTTDQVRPASEILKGPGTVDHAAEPGPDSVGEDAPSPVAAAAAASPRPLPSARAVFEPPSQPGGAPPQHPAGSVQRAGGDPARLGRYFIYYGLALVASFMIGAWLGLLS